MANKQMLLLALISCAAYNCTAFVKRSAVRVVKPHHKHDAMPMSLRITEDNDKQNLIIEVPFAIGDAKVQAFIEQNALHVKVSRAQGGLSLIVYPDTVVLRAQNEMNEEHRDEHSAFKASSFNSIAEEKTIPTIDIEKAEVHAEDVLLRVTVPKKVVKKVNVTRVTKQSDEK